MINIFATKVKDAISVAKKPIIILLIFLDFKNNYIRNGIIIKLKNLYLLMKEVLFKTFINFFIINYFIINIIIIIHVKYSRI